jgi:hypothetical protein
MKRLRFDEILSDDRHLRSDLRLLERAVRERWAIELMERRIIVEKIVEISNRLGEKEEPTGIDRRAMIRLGMLAVAMDRASYETTARAMDSLRSGERRD